MLSLVTSTSGAPAHGPAARPVCPGSCHQLRIQVETRPRERSSAPCATGTNESGSIPAIIPSTRSPLERPSTPIAFILVPAIQTTWRIKSPFLAAWYRRKITSERSAEDFE